MATTPEITADTAIPAATDTTSATDTANALTRLRTAFDQLNNTQKLMLAAGVAAIIAILVGTYLWNKQPDYKVLFANYSEKDGGAIIAALEQANVPYQYSAGGSAILVPAAQVHDVRLRLAAQGLPRGGSVGFELMETQKFGTSQFIEQVNYQRALEGELARTIESISAVDSARVHLAIPKPSVFVREEQKPTASVLLHLFPGRALDPAQIAGISHLISSSVPQLPITNVNIVDQDGNLISQLKDKLAEAGLDANQLKYVHEKESSIAQRIEAILAPWGTGNYRVQVAADLDFSHVEQTAETFRPNGVPAEASIRSEQISESANLNQQPAQGGVPGALTNQPPVPAIAPLTQPPITPPPGEAGGAPATPANPANPDPRDPNRGRLDAAGVHAPLNPVSPPLTTQTSTTRNYEVDKTLTYTRQAAGTVRRLTAAVVMNYRMVKDKNGVETPGPLPENELKQIHDLVREAMGYDEKRGDALSVANIPFTSEVKSDDDGIPLWKDPENVARGMDILKYLVIAGILFAIYFVMLRPVLRSMFPPPPEPEDTSKEGGGGDGGGGSGIAGEGRMTENGQHEPSALDNFAAKVEKAKGIAQSDPKIVADTIKDWLGLNG
ncbi:MAG: flagellar M-ring protein FliF [Zoogloeaceae bacterium]|jgi:flagellar M-ring protein FliF|nr:flagellar M-ring protein FliF [Zoogloeaceae bacterium]